MGTGDCVAGPRGMFSETLKVIRPLEVTATAKGDKTSFSRNRVAKCQHDFEGVST